MSTHAEREARLRAEARKLAGGHNRACSFDENIFGGPESDFCTCGLFERESAILLGLRTAATGRGDHL